MVVKVFLLIFTLSYNKTKITTMNNLLSRLNIGINHFGSSSYNTPEFDTFFNDFRKSFTNQLKKLNAKEIKFNKGHFFLSGFFKVGEQCFYFSLSDVRNGFGDNDMLLIRTAKDYKDYTGGSNNYVKIQSGMYKDIAKTFNLEVKQYENVKKDSTYYAKKIIEKGGFVEYSIPSMKKANFIAWKVADLLDLKNQSITEYRLGGYKTHAKMETDLFDYNYNVSNKTLTINFFNESEEDFKKRVLKNKDRLSEMNYEVTNPFSGEKCELTRDEYVVYNFVKRAEMENRSTDLQKGLSLFAEMNAEKYMVLLD